MGCAGTRLTYLGSLHRTFLCQKESYLQYVAPGHFEHSRCREQTIHCANVGTI